MRIKFATVAHLAEGRFLHAKENKDEVSNITR